MVSLLMLAAARSAKNHRGGAIIYATLNPADKAPNVILSGDLLSVTGNASGIVRATKPIIGKRYFEALWKVSSAGAGVISAGVATSTASLTIPLGQPPDGWAMWGFNRGTYHNNVLSISQNTLVGDVIGFAIDQPGGKMWVSYNGTWLGGGDPAAGTTPVWSDLSGTLYPAAGPWLSGTVIAMRFDPATFTQVMPSGFAPVYG